MPRRLSRNSSLFSRTSRRRFLQGSVAALAGVGLSNCRRTIGETTETPPSADTTDSAPASGTLHIYTWADYTDDELAAQFTEATGIEVKIDVYDSNETMLAKMQAGGGANYSLLYPSDYMVTEMIGLGMLTELDKSRLVGLDKMREKWKSPVYDEDNTHSIPYSWGTTGLLYNSEVLTTAPTDWDYLWDNSDVLSRKMTMLDDVRETMGAVLSSLGYSYNATDPAQLEEAYQKLLELKPSLASFKSFGWQDELLSGDLLLSMVYSVEGIPVSLENPNFKYVIPESGSSVWTDTIVIPTSAPNVEAAYEWINFNLQPQVSKDTVERLFFATPNGEAMTMLSQELLDNKNLFPPEDILAKCEGIAPVGEANALYDEYWTKVTSA
ncbi:spermidine/putrescine ABC transporter substrate-binding protein [Leptolyngbyaceae cyanobacterium CCMR0082]|uniref:Spermidine/putrescine ABC transporter substrate-binding protein n=2 Tax=Adonisia turfae TaxID=2950184 RepID=A0A6M0S3P3_9CYAN|nr:spermidine/putrescine ABC transporter substrate-binding protein [Adonisia turfae CCMR0081]NEZ62581.1 spermidine/putrescine ABC transporter substrate-binding protein [Adonisia turfae CCMR0082]